MQLIPTDVQRTNVDVPIEVVKWKKTERVTYARIIIAGMKALQEKKNTLYEIDDINSSIKSLENRSKGLMEILQEHTKSIKDIYMELGKIESKIDNENDKTI